MSQTDQETDPQDPNLGSIESLTPRPVLVLAETAREYVQRAVGVELDLTPETLPVLDHYLTLVRDGSLARSEILPVVAGPVGAYFGLLVAERFGCSWQLDSEDPAEWVLYCRSVILALNPVGVALDVMCRGADHEGPSPEYRLLPEHAQAVVRRLAALPDVREDEFHMLSTRFEVLEVVHDELLGLMQRENEQGVRFEWADYEVLFRRPAVDA